MKQAISICVLGEYQKVLCSSQEIPDLATGLQSIKVAGIALVLFPPRGEIFFSVSFAVSTDARFPYVNAFLFLHTLR